MKCIIILPCFNEGKNLYALISKINKSLEHYMPYLVIAVNDGSTDDTADILRRLSEEYPIEILEHKKNEGLACALRTGLKAAIKHISYNNYVVIMDADNTHDPSLIPDMVGQCKHGADLVIASRYVRGGNQIGVPWYRVVLSKVINFLIRLQIRANIKDCTSGYRCYTSRIIHRLFLIYHDRIIESKGFEVVLELLIKSINVSAKIAELPMSLNYERKKGESKLKIVPTMLRYIRILMQLGRWSTVRINTQSNGLKI